MGWGVSRRAGWPFHPTPGPYSHTPLVVWHIGTASFWKTVLYGDTSLVAQRVKLLPAMQETQVQSLGQEDPPEKEMATHSSILAEFCGQRSLVGYSPWGCKELDTIERLHFTFSSFYHRD